MHALTCRLQTSMVSAFGTFVSVACKRSVHWRIIRTCPQVRFIRASRLRRSAGRHCRHTASCAHVPQHCAHIWLHSLYSCRQPLQRRRRANVLTFTAEHLGCSCGVPFTACQRTTPQLQPLAHSHEGWLACHRLAGMLQLGTHNRVQACHSHAVYSKLSQGSQHQDIFGCGHPKRSSGCPQPLCMHSPHSTKPDTKSRGEQYHSELPIPAQLRNTGLILHEPLASGCGPARRTRSPRRPSLLTLNASMQMPQNNGQCSGPFRCPAGASCLDSETYTQACRQTWQCMQNQPCCKHHACRMRQRLASRQSTLTGLHPGVQPRHPPRQSRLCTPACCS